jgi:CheY-like chemotaxis protein
LTLPTRNSQQELAEIETIYAIAPIGLCFINTELRFVRLNERLTEINGVSVREHLGRTLQDITPQMADVLEPLYQQVIESGEAIMNLEVHGSNRAQPGVEKDAIQTLGLAAETPGENQGSTFTVKLPLAPTDRTISSQIQQETAQGLELSNMRVLVVDDDMDSRDFITFALEQAGALVMAVASAVEALEALSQFEPDVLVSDIGMPMVDGYQLLRQIRALPAEQGGQIPAVALTAYAGEINQQQAIAVGFQHHLSKPIDPDELIATIATLATK